MTSKELIKKAFGLQEVEHIPWIPFVGCNGMYGIGRKFSVYQRSGQKKSIE